MKILEDGHSWKIYNLTCGAIIASVNGSGITMFKLAYFCAIYV